MEAPTPYMMLWIEHRLVENTNALRRLPSTHSARVLPGVLARSTLAEVLTQADGQNALNWLRQHRPIESAVLVLALLLDQVALITGAGLQVQDLVGAREFERKYAPLYGKLLSLSRDPQPIPWTNVLAGIKDRDRLIREWNYLRKQADLGTVASPSLSEADPTAEALAGDLLRLPESVDPIEWLQDERSALTTYLALNYLVSASVPEIQIHDTAPMRSVQLGDKLSISNLLKLTVEQIHLYDDSFSVHINARFRRPKGYPSFDLGRVLRWDGFHRITDDRGYQYIIQRSLAETVTTGGGWRERLTITCWPALNGAGQLRLGAAPTTLSLYRAPQVGGTLIPEPTPILGDVVLLIDV